MTSWIRSPSYLLACVLTLAGSFGVGRTLRPMRRLPPNVAHAPEVPEPFAPPTSSRQPNRAAPPPPEPSPPSPPEVEPLPALDEVATGAYLRLLPPRDLLALASTPKPPSRSAGRLGPLERLQAWAHHVAVERAAEFEPLALLLIDRVLHGQGRERDVAGDVLTALPTLSREHVPRLAALFAPLVPYDLRRRLLPLVERLGPLGAALAPALDDWLEEALATRAGRRWGTTYLGWDDLISRLSAALAAMEEPK